MEKRALIVGIDHYQTSPLSGCVNDANSIAPLLESNGDTKGSSNEKFDNFSVHRLTSDKEQITRTALNAALKKLFIPDGAESALFYFAGHGYVSESESILVTADSRNLDDDITGVTMESVLTLANKSNIPNKIILLDCCHSGSIGEVKSIASGISLLGNGLTIIAACRPTESAIECNGRGIFTQLVVNGLNGEAADANGEITAASLYSLISRGLRHPWIDNPQRPVYKTNVDQVVPIRRVTPRGPLNPEFLDQLADEARNAVRYLADTNLNADERRLAIKGLDGVIPPLRQLRLRINDWDQRGKKWIRDFYDGVERYAYIYSTDLRERSSIGEPEYERYLREQYTVRAEVLNRADQTPALLPCSCELRRAIENAGWEPNLGLWRMPSEVAQAEGCNGPEFARILIRPAGTVDETERDALYVLDIDHKLFGIPLFVIEEDNVEEGDRVDFTIALDKRKDAIDGYEFDEEKGLVEKMTKKSEKELRSTFMRLMNSHALVTVPEHLGHVMIRDPEKSKEFAKTYVEHRKASMQLVSFIKAHVKPNGEKLALDVGCGTGNYTWAFAGLFKRVVGLDINRDMLDEAKNNRRGKQGLVEFVCRDAASTKFDDEKFDSIWSISTLHYLKGRRQQLFFKEAHRVLRPGGTLVVDVGEYLEQHPSLWIMEYFPSLRERYKGALHQVSDYDQWLRKAGFSQYECETLDYEYDGNDAFLRAGVRYPKRYLDEEFQTIIPAFVEMRETELKEGIERLKEHINNGKIKDVMEDARRRAALPGDLGVLVATKS